MRITKHAVVLQGLLLIPGFACTTVCAQQPGAGGVDSGQLLKRLEQPWRPPVSEKPDLRESPLLRPAPDLNADSATRVFVKNFRVTPEGLLTQGEIDRLLAAYTGKDVSMGTLHAAVEVVGARVRSKGYSFVRPYLPPQEVTEGIVTIGVLVGKLGTNEKGEPDISLREKPLRLKMSRTLGIATGKMKPGQPLRDEDMERGLLLLNDLPGIQAGGVVVPGREPGTVGIVVDAREEDVGSALLAVDNYGSRSTGWGRGTLFATASDPSGYGDLLRLGASGSEGTRSLFASYLLPLGYSVLKLRATGSALQYKIVHGSATALDLEGAASSAGLGLSYPIVRDRNFTLVGFVQADGRFMRDSALGSYISHRYTKSVTAGSQLYWTNPGVWSVTGDVGGTGGRLLPGDPDRAPGTAVGTATREGNYAIGRASLTIDRAIGRNWAIQVAANGQIASQDLDSSEKFYAGGPSGVRAYPIEEAASDSGVIAHAELQWYVLRRETYGITLLGFYDWAHVRRNVETYAGWNNINPAMPNSYSLQGWGTGIRYNWSKFRLEALFARKIGDNPGRSTTGEDADGTSRRNRVWLLATLNFP